jgi:hypothetical protein
MGVDGQDRFVISYIYHVTKFFPRVYVTLVSPKFPLQRTVRATEQTVCRPSPAPCECRQRTLIFDCWEQVQEAKLSECRPFGHGQSDKRFLQMRLE